jgi:hypothetical protein
MALSHSPKIVTDGLLLALDAANTKSYPGSGTTWTDLSGNGNNGTLVNGVGYNSNNGGSLVFDGVNDYVDVSNTDMLQLSFPFSVEVWYYLKSPWPGGALGMVTKGPLSSDYDYMLYLTTSGTRWDIYKKNQNGTGAVTAGFSTSYSHFDRWNHICFSVDINGNAKGYENSFLRGTGTFSDTEVRKSTQTLKIGRGWGSTLDGNIGALKIYNKALSIQEIQQNFNALRGRYGI